MNQATDMTADVKPGTVRTPIPHSCPDIGEEEIAELVACARSLQLKGGTRVAALEAELARAMHYPGGVATPSGAQAIHLTLRVAYPRGGARIGLPSYICRSVYDAVSLAGCTPVLLDIDPTTLAVCQTGASARCDAVIVAHMFGIRADIGAWMQTGKTVIEDCAQRVPDAAALGSEPRAHFRVLSFEATKLLTCGEGGMLLCDGDSLHRACQLRDGGYDCKETAVCYALTDLQAAMVAVQWRRFPQFLERRRRLASGYTAKLPPASIFPAMLRCDTFPFRFLLQVKDPRRFLQYGAERGVNFRRPIAPLPLHRLFSADTDFPHTERAFDSLVSIPLYPRLTDAQHARVAEVALAALEDQS